MSEGLNAFISLENDQIKIQWTGLRTPLTSQALNVQAGFEDTSFFLNFFLAASKPIFFNELPTPSIHVTVDEAIHERPYLNSAAQSLQNAYQRTNQLLTQLKDKKGFASKFNRTLFYAADESPDIESLYREAEAKYPGFNIFKSFSTGWNKTDRRWEPSDSLSIESLVELISTERIRRIVTLNMYYLKHGIRDGVYTLAVLRYLGVDYIMIDLDVYDLTWNFAKSVFNDESSTRFSMFPAMAREWDEAYAIKNSRYIPCALQTSKPSLSQALEADFDIVVASHARLPNLLSQLGFVLTVLESCTDENLYDDFQLWYYSFRHWILNESKLSLIEKEYTNSVLYTLYLNGITFLKYETIESLNTAHKVRIFGDNAWGEVFREQYEGRYLENYAEVFSSRRALNLLLNVNFSYLEVNPVFQKALQLGAPFLGFPPLCRIEELEGLQSLEYRNTRELSECVNSINARFAQFKSSGVEAYMDSIIGGVRESLVQASRGSQQLQGIDRFESECRRHQTLALNRIQLYLARFQRELEKQFDLFFKREARDVHSIAANSRFSNRQYLKRLLALSPAVK